MKYILLFALFFSMNAMAQIGEVIRKDSSNAELCEGNSKNGDICWMRHYNAKSYCSKQGGRLPSAREFAQSAAQHGAKGIKEVGEYNGEEGYWLVSVFNENENYKVDEFYFSNAGHPRNFGTPWVWSSSFEVVGLNNDGLPYGSSLVAPFNPNGGIGDSFYPTYIFGGVRCITGR